MIQPVYERDERELTLVPATCRLVLPAAIVEKTSRGDVTLQCCSPSTKTPSPPSRTRRSWDEVGQAVEAEEEEEEEDVVVVVVVMVEEEQVEEVEQVACPSRASGAPGASHEPDAAGFARAGFAGAPARGTRSLIASLYTSRYASCRLAPGTCRWWRWR